MARKDAVKIVIDTNIWISFLIGKSFLKFRKPLENSDIEILYSEDLLQEIELVFQKPKLNKYFGATEIELVKELFLLYGVKISVTSEVNLCRDAKDNFLLALCKDGNADYLVTGDKDLLILEKIKKTRIITAKHFQTILSI